MESELNKNNGEKLSGPATERRLTTRVKAIACVAFLLLIVILWVISERSFLLLVLLAIPAFLCEEWLADKVNIKNSGWSTAEVGFSIRRIIYGVIIVLLFFAAAYALSLIV